MNRTRTLVALIAAAVLLVTPSLRAQQPVFVANVPFQFAVDNKTLPAGTYRLQRQGAFLQIQNRQTPDGLISLPVDAGPSGHGRDVLVFGQVNGRYFLHKLNAPSVDTGLRFSVSRTEKRALEIARVDPKAPSATTQVAMETGAQ